MIVLLVMQTSDCCISIFILCLFMNSDTAIYMSESLCDFALVRFIFPLETAWE